MQPEGGHHGTPTRQTASLGDWPLSKWAETVPVLPATGFWNLGQQHQIGRWASLLSSSRHWIKRAPIEVLCSWALSGRRLVI